MTPEGATPDAMSRPTTNEDRRLVTGEILSGINADGLTLRIVPNLEAMRSQGIKRAQIEHILVQIVEGSVSLRNGNGAGEGREFELQLDTRKPEPAHARARSTSTDTILKLVKDDAQSVLDHATLADLRKLARSVLSLASAVETQQAE